MTSARAKAHVKHVRYCSCGAVMHGNGARAQHRAMHARRADGHCQVPASLWRAKGYVPFCLVCSAKAETFQGPNGMRCQAHKDTVLSPATITSDGVTVWVNGPQGLLGRFGRNGVDIHRPLDEQLGKGECLVCTHGPTTLVDWGMFVEKMLDLHGVSVHYGEYMPDRFRSDVWRRPRAANAEGRGAS